MKLLDRINEKKNEVQRSFEPKYMMLELTNACNHECLFCAHRKSDRPVKMMNKEFAFDMLEQGYNMGIREVGLFLEGESFLYKDLAAIIKKAKMLGYTYIYCTSNGALADSGKLIDAIDAGLDSIKFSINAVERNKYTIVHGKDDFEKVISNLKWLYEYKKNNNINLNIFVSSITTKYNKDTNLIHEVLDPICDELIIFKAYNVMGMMPELDEFGILECGEIECLKEGKLPCPMVLNRVHITVDGLLTACCTDINNYLVYADLKKSSLYDGWNSHLGKKFRERHCNKDVKGTICENCIKQKWENIEPLDEKYVYPFDIKKDRDNFARRIEK